MTQDQMDEIRSLLACAVDRLRKAENALANKNEDGLKAWLRDSRHYIVDAESIAWKDSA